jgi:hypothetical protein
MHENMRQQQQEQAVGCMHGNMRQQQQEQKQEQEQLSPLASRQAGLWLA